jgi:ATP-dependent DNA helicase RecG
MQIARGANEDLRPVNVGLLFFSEDVEKFFPYTRIEVNIYHDDIGDNFTEKVFKGPIHQQLRKALSYIKTQVVQEHVQKIEGQAEALRFYNYPFQAVEEALANAVYHKNYEEREPIEVNIRLDQIEILSHGGAMPPITADDFKKERIISRKYLNRRVGDFLKELHLTEGKGTGIPKIRRAMRNNGSEDPIFETDNDRSYFLTILPVRPFSVTVTLDPIVVSVETGGKPAENRRIPADTLQQEKTILEYLINHNTINTKQVEELLSIKKSRARELLQQMGKKGFVIKKGSGRSTHYVLGESDD